jgi:hypothetical protein
MRIHRVLAECKDRRIAEPQNAMHGQREPGRLSLLASEPVENLRARLFALIAQDIFLNL